MITNDSFAEAAAAFSAEVPLTLEKLPIILPF
jgi:hypothetical protein